MNYEFKVITEHEDDLIPFTNAIKNHYALSEIYQEVFRPVIRYSEDEAKVSRYEEVWKEVRGYLEGRGISIL
jgi:hypothetical protein